MSNESRFYQLSQTLFLQIQNSNKLPQPIIALDVSTFSSPPPEVCTFGSESERDVMLKYMRYCYRKVLLIKTSAGNEPQNPFNTLKHKDLFALSLIIYTIAELWFVIFTLLNSVNTLTLITIQGTH